MERTLAPSNICPFPAGLNVPVILPLTKLPVIPPESTGSHHPIVQGSYTEFNSAGAHSHQPFSQVELNDLTNVLSLSKDAAELLDSRLK
ncbi:hypothetical protein NPIL_17691 [Nephila pilipes]|uniref:Uncharacterized protein n=1 Tax=Nephila pilipes TaxID=299642 RepID=A0A8X6U879_NEPPI|nr:hypothetical protein NPIL_17691 [Nephila pilipes]